MSLLDLLVHPLALQAVLLATLLVAMRWRFPFTPIGGLALGSAVVALVVFLALEAPSLVERWSSPNALTGAALAALSAVVTWVGVRELGLQRPGGRRPAWTGPTTADLALGGVVVAALVVVALRFPAPLGPPGVIAPPNGGVLPPWWAAGWWELGAVARPSVLLALASLVGLAALPWLSADPEPREAADELAGARSALEERRYGVRFFLAGWWLLGIGPLLVGLLLRGPGGRLLSPVGEPSETPLLLTTLAEVVWIDVLRVGLPSHPLVRELFGLVVLASVLGGLPFLLLRRPAGRGLVRSYVRSIGPRRTALAALLTLFAALLLAKWWLFLATGLRSVVDLPELGASF